MTRDELRIRISATLMVNAAHDYPTRMDAVMAEVDRYLIEFEADAAAELAARLPEIAVAEQARIADALRTRATGEITTGRIAEAFDVPVELLASGVLTLPGGSWLTITPPTSDLNTLRLNAKGEWTNDPLAD